MSAPYQPMKAQDILDTYFIENRSRVLDIAAFLDRIDRHEGADEARAEYRYQAFVRILEILLDPSGATAPRPCSWPSATPPANPWTAPSV
jgi:hypothetical protein